MNLLQTTQQLAHHLESTENPLDKLPLLAELSEISLHRQPSRARGTAFEVKLLAGNLNDRYWTGTGHYLLGRYYTLTDQCLDARFHLESALGIFRSIGDQTMQAKVGYASLVLRVRTRDIDNAIEEGIAILNSFRSSNNNLWSTRTRGYLGEAYAAAGALAEARKTLRYGIRTARTLKLPGCLAKLYHELAYTVYETGEIEECERYLRKGLLHAEFEQDRVEQAIINGKMGGFYLDRLNYASAIKFAQKSIDLFTEVDLPIRKGNAVGTISTTLVARKEEEEAMKYEQMTMDLLNTSDNPLHRALIHFNVGKRMLEQKIFAEGIPRLIEGIDLIEKMYLPRYQYFAYRLLSGAFEATGNSEKALHYYKLYTAKQQEMTGVDQMNAIRREEIKWATRASRAKARQQKELIDSMREELKKKEQNLLSLALQLTEQSEELAQLKQRRSRTGVASVSTSARSSWDRFAQQFYVVHQDFYSRLLRTYPELTTTELKVCCLIRTGLSSKEIARLLHISSRTVDSHRERIRKKLPIAPRYALANFIKAV